jgi:hypothetical protein
LEIFDSFDPEVDFKELKKFANYVLLNHIGYDSRGPLSWSTIPVVENRKKVKKKQRQPE